MQEKNMQKNALHDFRESLDLTQREMAKLLGVSRAYYSQVECGMKEISDKLARKLEKLRLEGLHSFKVHSPHQMLLNSPNAKMSLTPPPPNSSNKELLAIIQSQQQMLERLIALTERLAK